VSSIAAGVFQFLEQRKVQRVEGKPGRSTLRIKDEELELIDR
jgi:hypothetical protein